MIRILVGDVRERLRDLPDGSVQCVVTSPPYFGLRDYGTASWSGGDAACDHQQGRPGSGRADGIVDERSQRNRDGVGAYGRVCRKCGAIRVDNQIGLEPTLAEYIATLVDVFREVRRVLRDDGTVWLNLGDSYAGSTQGGSNRSYVDGGKQRLAEQVATQGHIKTPIPAGLKPKDLMMVPARVAIALQDDGWYLRSDIIWAKKNCMPESVTDRPTSSHEHIFLLTKQAKYFYDATAVREPYAREWNPATNGGSWAHTTNQPAGTKAGHHSGEYPKPEHGGANMRNVWHLSTFPLKDAHFATFPPEIPRRCILAGTSEKGQCAACGAPWVRVVEKSVEYTRNSKGGNAENYRENAGNSGGPTRLHLGPEVTNTTTGWQPTCSCDADVVPQTVLDIFAGSGTTGLVADRLGRNAILIELNPEYAEMSRQRIYGDAPLFADVAAD